MVDAVFFDLDGTLVDTAPDFHTVLNAMLGEAGKPALGYDKVRAQVSNGARAVLQAGFGGNPGEAAFDSLLAEFLDRYVDHLTVGSQLFAGMDEVLDKLEASHIPWGIVTNKPERFTTPLLAGLKLASRVGPVICPDNVAERKPQPEGLLKAASMVGVQPERCIYVGDHERDIAAGRNAGMRTIGVLFGYIGEDEDPQAWRADMYAADTAELAQLLNL
ncbi:HAD-IA family hydrolase [Alcanivorax sp. 1008]|uniref:HAD-IA family hydrolase n=1 Tax=Alcanivorax sp. 1008 TaxID=2816853 RepID=UPI001D7B5022|nr:HAD-IA family hydrolase [Alcanivorax sp. 1008]MCC1495718.1 HAD-IA family hydrolase [Alcanivorax sp. 1008]